MDFGINLFFEKELGYQKSLRKAANAGFKYVDFDATEHNLCSAKDEERVFKEFKRITDGEGMKIVQAHAPYVRGTTPNADSFTCDEFIENLKASIRCSAILDVKYLVVHPFIPYVEDYENTPYDYEIFRSDNVKRTIDVFGSLEKYLNDHNVTLCIENCYAYDFVGRKNAPSACSTSKELNEIIDVLGSKSYGVCFDAGHLNLLDVEGIESFTSNLNDRIKVLHLHDNFGALNDWFGELDRHLLPFMGCLDWQTLKTSLNKINYNGVISFEFSSHGPKEFADEYYKYVYNAANLIWGK